MPKEKSVSDGGKPREKKNQQTQEYGAKQITVLEGLEPVRKRPGMYIGNTADSGLHHLIWEVVDNSIDEAMAGHCDTIRVTLLPDSMVRVEDNGRGIPVEKHPVTKKSTLETVLTTLHAGGKFGQGGYKVSGGLHGVGVSVVNALSQYVKAEVKREGKLWMQEYVRGQAKKNVHAVGTAKGTGTIITFQPDPQIFSTLEFKWETILTHLRQQAYLTKGVKMIFEDQRTPGKNYVYTLHFEGGIASYVTHLNHNKTIKQDAVFYIEKEAEGVLVEVAVQYTDDYSDTVMSFANNIHTVEGGMHEVGFKTALTRSLNNYARKNNILKEKDQNLTGDDVREGLTAVISVKIPDPQFEGQTKAKLGNIEARSSVDQIFHDYFTVFLEEHPQEAKEILGKVLLAAQARMAARAARDSVLRKGALDGFTLPGKLADCSSRNRDETELYIVEGDSAGGCFSGDTKVALVDGRNLSFKELVEEEKQGRKNYCYTINESGSIAVAPIKSPRITKKDAAVIKLILDSGEEITCTPDHRFMLADRSFTEAQKLTSKESLMPLRRQLSHMGKRITIEGYEMVFDPAQARWIFTHLLSDAYNLKEAVYENDSLKSHRHHQDFNKRNNNPDNLLRLSKEEHLDIHRKQAKRTLHRPDVIEKSRQLRQTPAFREKIRQIMSTPEMRQSLRKRAKKQWEDPQYREFMKEKFLEYYYSHPEYRDENSKRLQRVQKEYWGDENNRQSQSERTRQFFETHPDRKDLLSDLSKKQWNDPTLLEWRKRKTQQQWTTDFRKQRYESYQKTYYHKALKTFYEIYQEKGSLDLSAYESIRKVSNDKSLLRYETILERFFEGNRERLVEAAKNYNHRIQKIEVVNERMDVYDLEVPGTHNFALASGVFVHNSAKQGRDRNFQAILPLRGKILNVEKSRLDRMLTNNEIKALVIALGTNIGDMMDIEKLRYDKIIIMTDADVDGAHIRTLLLTLFYRHFPELIREGHLYIAQPPLYKLSKGSSEIYAYSDSQKENAITELKKIKSAAQVAKTATTAKAGTSTEEPAEDVAKEDNELKIAGINIQRYKGLGEMNPGQLWETTMDPKSRLLLKVDVEDAEKADEIFDILMGSEVAPRKRFILTHAKDVQNLDI